MGRKPKKLYDADFFLELESSNPKAAFMRKKCWIIGKNMRELRRQRRFSVEDLAEYLMLSESYIGLLERGDRCPSLKIVYKLCDLFGVTPNDLMTLSDAEAAEEGLTIAEDKAGYNTKLQTDAIYSLVRTLSESEVDFIIETIRNVKRINKAN
jgi:transcriptional regulator with XRE-family HTH domain